VHTPVRFKFYSVSISFPSAFAYLFCSNINNRNPSDKDDEQQKKSRTNVNTACQTRVRNTEKIRRALWKSYDFHYDDNDPPQSFPGDGSGNPNGDDEDDANVEGGSEQSGDWILRKSTKKLTCPHYRQLTTARTAQMLRSDFLVNQKTIDCCTTGGEKTKLGVHDIEDLVGFGVDPYVQKSVALYRQTGETSFGLNLGSDCTIKEVTSGGAAESSGQIKKGDKIIGVNEKKVTNVQQIRDEISGTTSDPLELRILRHKSIAKSRAAGGCCESGRESPATEEEIIPISIYRAGGQGSFGMGLAFRHGVCTVEAIHSGGAAEKNGLVKIGDTIVGVNGKDVENLPSNEIAQEIAKTPAGDPLEIIVVRRSSAKAPSETSSDDYEGDGTDIYSPHSPCPYYLSRALSKHAELIFAPYNYILDPGIRKALDIDLSGSVVVLDEAHNVEGTLIESGSGKFGEIDLAGLFAMLSYHSTAMKGSNSVEVAGDKKDLSEIAHELLLFVEKLVLYMRELRKRFENSAGE
jgi:hypothetical protein